MNLDVKAEAPEVHFVFAAGLRQGLFLRGPFTRHRSLSPCSFLPLSARLHGRTHLVQGLSFFWANVRTEAQEVFPPPGWHISVWGRVEMQHLGSRAWAEHGIKEGFRQVFLLSQVDPRFVWRRGKVTIKLHLTLWVLGPACHEIHSCSTGACSICELPVTASLGAPHAAEFAEGNQAVIWAMKCLHNPLGSHWKQRALFPGPAFVCSYCNCSQQSPVGKKISSNKRRKVFVALAGNTCREGSCSPVAWKAVLDMHTLRKRRIFTWAERRNKVNVGGGELCFRGLPTME